MGNCSGSNDKTPTGPFEDSYELMTQIGEGSTALVFKGRNKVSSETVAVKVIDKTKFSAENLSELVKEADYLRQLNQKSIIKLRSFHNDNPEKSYMAMEMMTGGDVFERLGEKTVYSEPAARSLIRNLLDALKYIHKKGIAHRDLKLAALMLREKSSDSDVVLMDFGLAARTGGPTKRTLKDECGTPGYAAPEVLNGGPYGVECDIWAVGVIAFALLGGYPPFHSEDEDEVLTKSANADFSFDPDFWTPITPAAKEFISEALVVSQDKRPTAAQCLTNSSWLSPKYDEVVAQADAKRQKKAKAQTRKSKQALGGGGKPALSSKRGGAAPRKSGGAAVRSSGIKSGGPQNKGSAPLRASKVNNALLSGDSSVRSLSPASTASTRA